MQGGLDFLKTMGAARLAAMGAVGVGLIGFFAFLILYLSSETMVPIYTDLDYDDSGAVVRELEARGVPYEMRRDGSTILVPESQMLRLRMDLASDGLPTGGGVGYEIFDRGDTLGATSFVQNINHLRALEGELARTIRELDRVAAARVHLVIPERRLFSQDASSPSASIVVKTRGALDPAQIRAIRHLAASAVEGLIPARVAIVDDSGRLLADGSGAEDPGSATVLDERRRGIEQQLRLQIENIVSSVVGAERVRVQVAAELEFNRVTQTTDQYDPDGRVVRSSQLREESSTANEANPDGATTLGNELPGADAAANLTGTSETATTTEEVTNYEISRTTKTEVIEPGRVKRLSVAVVVDGIYSQNANGEIVYEPRTQDQLDRIAALVRSAVGFDADRGDTVEVANLRFAAAPQGMPLDSADSFLPTFTKADIMRFAELAVLFLLGMLVLLFVARPLVGRILAPERATGTAMVPAPSGAEPGEGEPRQLAAPEDAKPGASMPVPQTFEAINFAEQVGEVQAASLRRVGEIIEQNPTEALSIIRSWIHEAAA
ncbi:flagellar basal-body MS-ring/collar protein FliF [Microbaculum marinisediminis]|uniref:Flagellar M-ring protein n=1 Tax=Microbaculum marinisediminis TaxID=2931392 RepID=A0AAW5QUN8_9HYPH|nr:flagellar basal-body MS-ring/collar protein FliF [Microbaculum sp. A6E488]MCT8971796.1 flagellar M-ring protein FliF [Microbaculum sp. A6E488]